jgi:hypothetical protein
MAGFLTFLVLFLVLSSLSWIYRDGLARHPGDAGFRLQVPQAAFPMPDGGFAIVDSGSERIVRFNATGQIRWEIHPRTLFGRFLALDAAPDGMLYAIDEIEGHGTSIAGRTEPSQRLVRIGLDGSLAEVLLERKVTGGAGFIPGSLRVQDDVLWYLYHDGTASVLVSLDMATLSERNAGRSEWILDRASLAPGGPDGRIAVAAGGALVLFQRERFETLSEYTASLPFPACVRYDELGRLYIADPVAGLIVRLVQGQPPEVIVSASNRLDSSGLASLPGFAFDSFSIGPEGLVLVDSQALSVLVVDPGSGAGSGTGSKGGSGEARIVRELGEFSVPEAEVRRSWLAWTLLGGSLLCGLVVFGLLVRLLAVFAPRPLAFFGASLPGLLGIALVLALTWYSQEAGRQATSEAAALERLRLAAVAGAGALSGTEFSGAPTGTGVHPRSSEAWDKLRRRLASMVEPSENQEWPPVSAVLYLESEGVFRYIGDSDGLHVPGMAQSMAPASFGHAVLHKKAEVTAVDSGGQRWLSAVVPLDTPGGGPVILLEMASLAHVPSGDTLQRLLTRYVPVPGPGLLWALFVLGMATFTGLPLLVSARREGMELKDYRIQLSHIDDKRRAVAALKAGNADEARRILEKFSDRQPVDPQALNNLGAAYARLGRLEEASRCFNAVVGCQPGNAVALANLARLKDRQAAKSSSSRRNRR